MSKSSFHTEVESFLNEAITSLKGGLNGCWTHRIDDRLAICVGWEAGFGEEPRTDVIQCEDDLDWALVAAIKVYTSDDMLTDMEYINYPYYKSGEVIDYSVSIEPHEDITKLATYFIDCYDKIKYLNIDEDGLILEENN